MKKLELKKKILKFSIIALLLSALILVACTKDNFTTDSAAENTLRESFLKQKDFSTIKSDFNNLTEKEKIALWNEKLDQLLTQNLPLEHKKLIIELNAELKKTNINVENVSNISFHLANITPEDDFYQMFMSLNDYKFEGGFIGTAKVNDALKKSLKLVKFNYTKNTNIPNLNAKTNGGACNCNWTCSLYAGGSTTNCRQTTSGCGFLWAFPCENRVEPTLEALPIDDVENGIEIEFES